MSQLAPDDRVIHTRYQELGALASVLLSLAPQRLVFFRADAQGDVAAQGAPSVLVVKETELPLLERAAWVYAQVPNPGPIRVFWYTPVEYAAMHDSEFAIAVRLRGEDVVLPPPAEPADLGACEGGSCGLCGRG